MSRSLLAVLAMSALAGAWSVAGCAQENPWVYTVTDDDTSMADVSLRVYGDAAHAGKIAEANPNIDPDGLRPGQELVIPAVSDREPACCDRRRIEVE